MPFVGQRLFSPNARNERGELLHKQADIDAESAALALSETEVLSAWPGVVSKIDSSFRPQFVGTRVVAPRVKNQGNKPYRRDLENLFQAFSATTAQRVRWTKIQISGQDRYKTVIRTGDVEGSITFAADGTVFGLAVRRMR